MMKAPAALAVLLLLVLVLVPLAAADNDSLKVVVVVEDKAYSVGTTGKVTVHVFDKGAPVDADKAPAVRMGIYPSRDINVTRKSPGVYEGTFTLATGDVLMGAATITAEATLGKSNETDTVYDGDTGSASILLPISSPAGLNVECYTRAVSGGAFRPGASVTVEIKVQDNGTPVEPGALHLEVSYLDRDFNDHTQPLNTTKSATGVYQAVYELPGLDRDEDFTFEASATYQSSSDTSSTTVSMDLLNVIYHHISRTATSTTFDLYVADIKGKAVKGAVLEVSSWPDSNGSAEKALAPATTDSGGKARLTIPFAEGTKVLHVDGTANASGWNQSFSGTIRLQKETASRPTPHGDGFEVDFAGDDVLYQAGSSVSREYYVFNNSNTWANKPVYCYVVFSSYTLAPRTLRPVAVDAKKLTTDGAGKLMLSVKTPANKDTYAEISFESATGVHDKPDGWLTDHDSLDGLFYATDGDSFMAGRGNPGEVVKVTIPELRIGSPTQVKATARSGDRPLAYAAWGVGAVDNIYNSQSQEGNWAMWNQVPSILTRNGSTYTGTVTIPAFMPSDSKYTIAVLLDSQEMMPGYGMASLSPGQGTTGAGLPLTWILLIIVILVVVIVVAVLVVWARRRPAPVAPSDVIDFSKQPAGTQPPPVPAGGAVAPGETAGPAGPGAPPMPPVPPQPFQQAAPQQPAAAPPQYRQPAYVAAPPPAGPLPPPSRSGKLAMPNNAMCAFCNQWLLQGTTGVICQCGKVYHEHCAKIQEQCGNCGTKLPV